MIVKNWRGSLMVILDATAGNRMMWKNKAPPNVVFVDKEYKLKRAPDVFCVWKNLPFRSGSFSLIIFDPPHMIHSNPLPYLVDPMLSFYGVFKNKRELVINIIKAAKEFHRVGERLCLKWYDEYLSLWRLLPLFKPWKEVYRLNLITLENKKRKQKYNTWWITFEK